MSRSTRTVAALAATALITLVTAGPALAAPHEAAPSAVSINVGYMPNMQGGAPIAIGEDQGYFADEGLTLNKSPFTAGPVELTAMIAGQLDIGYIGLGAMPSLFKGEVQLLTLDHPTGTEYIIATEESGVEKPADLKGKTVLFAAGTTAELIVRNALASAGLSMSDINAVNSPDASSTTAYTAGMADVIAVGPAFTAQAAAAIPTNRIYSTADAKDFNLPGAWVVNKDFMKNNPELVSRFLHAFAKANDYRADHVDDPDDMLAVTSALCQVPAEDLKPQVTLTTWWTTDELIDNINSGEVDKLLTGVNQSFVDANVMTSIAPVSSYFDAKATVAGYTDAQSSSAVTKVGGSDFPVLPVVIGVIGLVIVLGIVFLVRRARA